MTVKIKEHYFNYDNVEEIDFEIRKDNSDGRYYFVNVYSAVGQNQRIGLTEEEYKLAEERLELGIINNFVFIDLLNE